MNKKQIKIRTANIKDSGALAEIGAKTFFETYSDKINNKELKLYIKQSFSKEKIKNDIKEKSSVFFIIFNKNQVIGYAKLNKGKNPKELRNLKAIEIERTYISKEFRGKGIGKILMKKCISIAEKEGFEVIWAGIWEHNSLSITICKRLGFKLFSSQAFQLGNLKQTDLLLKKEI